MWVLYVLSSIGAVAIIAMLGFGVSKIIDLFDKIDSIDRKYENIDGRYLGHERSIANIHNNLTSVRNNISILSARMVDVEDKIRALEETKNV